eukprot:2293976-Rhodomonas_salina.1
MIAMCILCWQRWRSWDILERSRGASCASSPLEVEVPAACFDHMMMMSSMTMPTSAQRCAVGFCECTRHSTAPVSHRSAGQRGGL